MKSILITLVAAVALISCTKDPDESNLKGLVSFQTGPAWTESRIEFSAQIQFGEVGRALNCEYEIRDGSSVLFAGEVPIDESLDGGLGAFWGSDLESVSIDPSAYSGKVLTVYLDPEHKITLAEYTSELFLDTYKRSDVEIP